MGVVTLVVSAVSVVMPVLKIVRGRWSVPDLCLDAVCLVVFAAIGLGLLVRPLGTLTDAELTLRALFGSRHSRYPADELRFVGGRVCHGDKPILGSWTTNRADWRSLVQRVQARDA